MVIPLLANQDLTPMLVSSKLSANLTPCDPIPQCVCPIREFTGKSGKEFVLNKYQGKIRELE